MSQSNVTHEHSVRTSANEIANTAQCPYLFGAVLKVIMSSKSKSLALILQTYSDRMNASAFMADKSSLVIHLQAG